MSCTLLTDQNPPRKSYITNIPTLISLPFLSFGDYHFVAVVLVVPTFAPMKGFVEAAISNK